MSRLGRGPRLLWAPAEEGSRGAVVRRRLPLLVIAVMAMYTAANYGWLQHAQRAAPPGQLLECQVTWVDDGDTVRAHCGWHGYTIRVWGIDAPELHQSPWGERAHRRLQALAGGRRLRVLVRDRDRYGRVVAQLIDAGRDLGLELVAQGYATVYERYNRESGYLKARDSARERHLGIWTRPGLQQRPWVWRHRHPR